MEGMERIASEKLAKLTVNSEGEDLATVISNIY